MEVVQYKAGAFLAGFCSVILVDETIINGFEYAICFEIGDNVLNEG